MMIEAQLDRLPWRFDSVRGLKVVTHRKTTGASKKRMMIEKALLGL